MTRSLVVFALVLGAWTFALPAWAQDKLDRAKMTPIERDETPPTAVAVARAEQKVVIWSCAWSSLGRLATGDDRGKIHLFDMTGAEPRLISAFQTDPNKLNAVSRMAFSPDGKLLVVSNGLDFSVFEMTDGGGNLLYRQQGSTSALAFHPAGALASSAWGANPTDIHIFNLNAKAMTPIAKLRGIAGGNNGFSRDGKFFASGNFGFEVYVWKVDPQKGFQEHLKVNEGKAIKSFALSDDGKFLATSTEAKKIHVWDISGKKPEVKHRFDSHETMRNLYFTPDSSRVVGVNTEVNDGVVLGETRVWSLPASALEHSWNWPIKYNSQFSPNGMGNVHASALSPDGRHVALASHTNSVVVLRLPDAAAIVKADPKTDPKPGDPAEKSVFDNLDREKLPEAVRANAPVGTVAICGTGGERTLTALALSPLGRLAAGEFGGVFHIWDLTGAEPVELTLQNDPSLGGDPRLAFSPEGKLLAVNLGATVSIYEMVEAGARPLFRYKGAGGGMTFHPAGALAVGSTLLSLTPKGLAPLPVALRGAGGHLEFTRDGAYFASVVGTSERNNDLWRSEIMLWKIDPKRVVEFRKITENSTIQSFAFSPDGKTLATCTSKSKKIHLWDFAGEKATLQKTIDCEPWVKNLFFTPDGDRIVGEQVGNVRIWNRKTGELEHTLNWIVPQNTPYHVGSSGTEGSATLSPDGRYMAVSPHSNAAIIIRLPERGVAPK